MSNFIIITLTWFGVDSCLRQRSGRSNIFMTTISTAYFSWKSKKCTDQRFMGNNNVG